LTSPCRRGQLGRDAGVGLLEFVRHSIDAGSDAGDGSPSGNCTYGPGEHLVLTNGAALETDAIFVGGLALPGD
jgi:hypothetical protein